MSKKGFLVTFEGGEGCGKSTQVKNFCQFLKEQNIEYCSAREPGGTPFSESVRELVKNVDFKNKSDISELLLFESARADIIDKIIKPTLDSDKVMVLDRFYDSTLAYQGYGRGMDKNIIKQLNKIASQNIVPDLTFYLRISPQIAFERKKDDVLDAIELSGLEFHNKVADGFDNIAKENADRFVVIDAMQNIDKISQQIREKFMERYNGF